MIDYRKLPIGQMLECSAFDGGWPEATFADPADQAAYDEADAEARRLDQILRNAGALHNGETTDDLLREVR